MANSLDNKKLIKNTMFLYVRTVFIMIISLYTSRVIFQELGVSDYGLFNAVGGMVVLFAFLNNALSGSTQRFLSFSLGRGDYRETGSLFKGLFTLHIIIAFLFFVIIEIAGSILLKYVLNIPSGREVAAFFCFQFCTMAVCLDMLRMLFDADIIANEKMDFYAYLSIFEATMKLSIVFILSWINMDKLILYSFLYFISTVVVFISGLLYCKIKFKECVLSLSFDKKVIKEIGTYAGWNMLSHISYMSITQGVNVSLNVFCGTIVNAARGIAIQINGIITKLTNNYLTATIPQIIKLYANGNIKDMNSLVINVSKFSAFLYALIGVPFFLDINFILTLWLGSLPSHASVFSRIFLIQGFIIAFTNPLTRVVAATGDVKKINIFDFFIQMTLTIGIIYLLYLGVNVDYVMTLLLFPNFFGFIYYLYLAKIQAEFDVNLFLKEALLPLTKVLLCTIMSSVLIFIYMDEGYMRFLLILLSNCFSLSISVWYLGIGETARRKIYNRFVLLTEKYKSIITHNKEW